MKKVFAVIFSAMLMTSACSKTNLPGIGDDGILNARQEDNPNGGGGNNIPSSNVPGAVMSSFNKLFPGATNMEWKQLSDGNFKVEFLKSNVKWQVIFSPSGTVIKQEHK